MDTIARSYKYRLYPNADQQRTLEAWQQACWEVQRLLIQQRRDVYRLKQQQARYVPTVTSGTQGKFITRMRASIAHWRDVPADTMGGNFGISGRVDTAYKNMFRNIKAKRFPAGNPRWADRAADMGLTFRGSERGTKIVGEGRRYAYWQLAGAGKLGHLRVRMHRAIPDGSVIKQVHITHVKNDWYISFSCEIPEPEPLPETGKTVGVDLNCKHRGDTQDIAALSDGRTYSQDDSIRKLEKRKRVLERLVAPKRKTRGAGKKADPNSNRTKRRRARIAKFHQKTTRKRDHQQHLIAKRIVDTADTIGTEDLNFAHMTKAKRKDGQRYKHRGRKLKRGLNKSMQSAAPGKLRQKIKEKAEAAGRDYHEVSAANTTQACSACGVKSPQKIELRTRAWKCGECGTEHDRDTNAARNISNRARAKTYPETPVCSGQVARGNAPSDVRREAERSASTPVNCEEAHASTSERGVPSPTDAQNASEHSTLYQLHMFDDCNNTRNSPAKSDKKRVAKKSRTNQQL